VPFCTHCGKPAPPADAFCRSCGARQPTDPPEAAAAAGGGLSPRAASILCYVPWLGWLAAVYVLASVKFQQTRDVRFHAYQGLYLFVAWLILDWAITPWIHLMSVMRKTPLEGMLQLFLLVVWIVMLIKTSRGERYSLPVVGELAERSL
jgi:uncharacterized membrane protein